MWAFARVNLRLSTEEFYRLTHRQLHLMMKQYDRMKAADTRAMELMLAQLTACTVNYGFRGPKEPVDPKEFLLRRGETPAKPVRVRIESKERISDRLRRQMQALMG